MTTASGPSHGVRPTKRCLDDLAIAPPTIDIPLHEIPDEPIAAAQSIPIVVEAGGGRRILGLTDRIWFKVKTSRRRGAVTRLTDADLETEVVSYGAHAIGARHRWWLGAVGLREDGSRDDFYAHLEARTACAWSPEKPHKVDTDALLPGHWDRRRLSAEETLRARRTFSDVLLFAAAQSLRSGRIVEASFGSFTMGAVVRADRGAQFVAFIARGVFDPKILAVMMNALPGVSATDWAPEPGHIADLTPRTGEIIWSAILTTDAANAILEAAPEHD